MRVVFLKQVEVIEESPRPCQGGRVLGEERVDSQNEDRRDQGKLKDRPPPIESGQPRREQRVQDGAAVSRPGDSHDNPLHVRGVPTPGLRQGNGETRARESKHRAHKEGCLVAGQPSNPRVGKARDHDKLRNDARGLRTDPIHGHAEDDAHECARKYRHGDHHSFCCAERPRDSPIWTPSGPRSVQIMKLASKYRNAASRVGQCPRVLSLEKLFIFGQVV